MKQKEEDILKVQFCIPPLGTEIILAKDWTFTIYNEDRNINFLYKLGIIEKEYNLYENYTKFNKKYPYGERICEITIPKGSKLSISRIYIRNGQKEYNSVTFNLKKHSEDKKIKGRFWAKLSDVNKIICYPIGTNIEIKETFEGFSDSMEKKFQFLDI